MSCWVVPSLAAELWGVPLEQVLGRVRAGAVASKVDNGTVLVDADTGTGAGMIANTDHPSAAPPPRRRRPRRPPSTGRRPAPAPGPAAVVLDAAELVALGICPPEARGGLTDRPPAVAAAGVAGVLDVHAFDYRAVRAPAAGCSDAEPEATTFDLGHGATPARVTDGRDAEADPSFRSEIWSSAVAAPAPGELGVIADAPADAHPLATGGLATPPAARAGDGDDESEDGPDPNHGEVDDGRPLGWRAARSRVAMTRRRPPKFG